MSTKTPSVFVTLLFLAMSRLTASALNLGTPVSRTPYDVYMGPVKSVLRSLSGSQVDLATVEKLVREGRSFRYIYKTDQPYVPQVPSVTESTKAGDCKAKSLWLASKMNSRRVRFVIGKAKLEDSGGHAWLIWEGPTGWLVLDATLYSRPLSPERMSPRENVPTFSYAANQSYTHNVGGAGAGARDGDH